MTKDIGFSMSLESQVSTHFQVPSNTSKSTSSSSDTAVPEVPHRTSMGKYLGWSSLWVDLVQIEVTGPAFVASILYGVFVLQVGRNVVCLRFEPVIAGKIVPSWSCCLVIIGANDYFFDPQNRLIAHTRRQIGLNQFSITKLSNFVWHSFEFCACLRSSRLPRRKESHVCRWFSISCRWSAYWSPHESWDGTSAIPRRAHEKSIFFLNTRNLNMYVYGYMVIWNAWRVQIRYACMYLSRYQSINLSIYLSVCLSIYLHTYLSVWCVYYMGVK